MKYEEHVLPNGNWGRPQVPFVGYEGFSALKDYLHEGMNEDMKYLSYIFELTGNYTYIEIHANRLHLEESANIKK